VDGELFFSVHGHDLDGSDTHSLPEKAAERRKDGGRAAEIPDRLGQRAFTRAGM